MPLLKMKHAVKTKQTFIDNTDCPDIPFTKIPYDSTFTNYGITLETIENHKDEDNISCQYGITFETIENSFNSDSIGCHYGINLEETV